MRRHALVSLSLLVAACHTPTATSPAPHASGSAAVTLAGTPLPPGASPAATPLPGSTPVVAASAPASPGTLVAALSGRVLAPAKLISDNGAGLISNNGGSIIANNSGSLVSNNGGGIIGNNGSAYRLADAAGQLPVVGLTVKLLDAAGKPLTDAAGKPITAVTDDQGRYAFANVPGDHNAIVSSDVGKAGTLTALATRGGAAQVDVDLVSTLTTTYILNQYVAGQQDPVTTLDKLPANVEADTRAKADKAYEAGTAPTPTQLTSAQVVATVNALRKGDATFDAQMEAVKKLLIVAGASDLGNGQPATQVDLTDIKRLLTSPDGKLYIVTAARTWRLAADGTLVAAYDPPAGGQLDGAIDDQGRLLALLPDPSAAAQHARFKVVRQDAPGQTTDYGTVEISGTAPSSTLGTLGLAAGVGTEAFVLTVAQMVDPAKSGGVSQAGAVGLWSVGPGRSPTLARALPLDPYFILNGVGRFGRAADGTIALVPGGGNGAYVLSPNATVYQAVYEGSFGQLTDPYAPVAGGYTGFIVSDSVTMDGRVLSVNASDKWLDLRKPDGTTQRLMSGDGVAVLNSLLGQSIGTVASDGTVYMAVINSDKTGHTVAKVFKVASGQATLVAGRDFNATGSATTLSLNTPTQLMAGPGNSVLIIDGTTVLQVGADGTATPWPGGKIVDTFDYTTGKFRSGRVRSDAAGILYYCLGQAPFGDTPGDTMVRLKPDGTTSTVYSAALNTRIGDFAIGPNGPLAAIATLTQVHSSTSVGYVPALLSGLGGSPVSTPLDGETQTFTSPYEVAADPAGNAYFADAGHVSTLAADGTRAPWLNVGLQPGKVFAFDPVGRLYLVTGSAAPYGIERYAHDGTHTTVAGAGTSFFAGTGVDDSLGAIPDMIFQADGTLLILDAGHKQVKRIPASGLP